MSRWLRRALAKVESSPAGVALVLDTDEIVDLTALRGNVTEVNDWWGLRAVYERCGRRHVDTGWLTIVVRGQLASEPLPWDIECASVAIVRVRLPGPPEVRVVLAELAGDEADRGIEAVTMAVDPYSALLESVTGVPIPHLGGLSRANQLRVAVRIAMRRHSSEPLSRLARRWVLEPLTAELLEQPPDVEPLQHEWARFIECGDSLWSAEFQAAQAEIGQLFDANMLRPVIARPNAPVWARVGVRLPTHEERAGKLLAERPTPFPPTDAAGWATVAQWWGEVRHLVAAAPVDLRARAWGTWTAIDTAFAPWLRERYGSILSSAAPWPSAVHRVTPFLARRLRDGHAERVLLVVLDGMGHAQWAHLRDQLPLNVVEAGSTFALVPTYTTVSRQALIAGSLPVTFPDSLWTTHREPRRWKAFWTEESVTVVGATYHRVKGRLPDDHIEFGRARAIAVVVNAVDDLMHTAELFGDRQLLANLDVWTANGFLQDLVRRATAAGIETWITADHGNIECKPAGAPSEGAAIESAGKRLLRYPNRVLRDASAADGIAWDDIPGLPNSAEPLLIAGGRLAFTNQQLSVSHGGLSIDEVVVPLVRVSA